MIYAHKIHIFSAKYVKVIVEILLINDQICNMFIFDMEKFCEIYIFKPNNFVKSPISK